MEQISNYDYDGYQVVDSDRNGLEIISEKTKLSYVILELKAPFGRNVTSDIFAIMVSCKLGYIGILTYNFGYNLDELIEYIESFESGELKMIDKTTLFDRDELSEVLDEKDLNLIFRD